MKSQSILIATYNRADVLRQTLEALCAVNREGLDVEFTIIDNGSADHTAMVLDTFRDRLPLRRLFQSKPGKSAALNLALDTIPLRDIVVFADDDIVPNRDWLWQIARTCAEWPDYGVFGGRIYLIWPKDCELPKWACREDMQWVFSLHDHGLDVIPYPRGQYTAGANMWVRRELCLKQRFNEGAGPGEAYGPGEDTIFAMDLLAQGHKALYVGTTQVGHLVQSRQFTESEVRKRAYRYGRGIPVRTGLPEGSLLPKHPYLYLGLRLLSISRDAVSAMLCGLVCSREVRPVKQAKALRSLGLNVGQFRLAWQVGKGLRKPGSSDGK